MSVLNWMISSSFEHTAIVDESLIAVQVQLDLEKFEQRLIKQRAALSAAHPATDLPRRHIQFTPLPPPAHPKGEKVPMAKAYEPNLGSRASLDPATVLIQAKQANAAANITGKAFGAGQAISGVPPM